jgi:hypothetical protein
MKARFILMIIALLIGGIVWIIRENTPPLELNIELRSDPFPMNVGPTRLGFYLKDVAGNPVNNAEVQVFSQMKRAGTLPIESRPTETASGEYTMSVTWPMMGQWTIDVLAEVPGVTVQEQFDVFVYSVPPRMGSSDLIYRSASEINAMVSANPKKELWIFIPQGTRSMMVAGEGADLIPPEIRLQASGRNVLIIKNDDIADHTIGPFFVRSGETIRQEFTQPAIFEGTCSVRHQDDISIIVDA